jgi:hypothetical protein
MAAAKMLSSVNAGVDDNDAEVVVMATFDFVSLTRPLS